MERFVYWIKKQNHKDLYVIKLTKCNDSSNILNIRDGE